MASVIIDAVLDDMTIRVIASADVALERANDLSALGWTVDIRDEDGALLSGPGEDDLAGAGDADPVVVVPEDAELPPLPTGLDPDSLRETG